MASNIKILDPVQGLIDYTNDIKPYHSKVIEALIEYVGTESIEVTVLEDFDFEIGLVYEFDGNYVCLIGGYGTPSFGDPENILVLSPDVSKTILDYPAIGPGFFIVLGDRTPLFDSEIDIVLSMSSFIEDKLVDVDVDATTGSPDDGSFVVSGDKTGDYPTDKKIEITGSAFNDGEYTVVDSFFDVGSPPAATRITVDTPIPTNNVEGFVRTADSTNAGPFSVINSTYNDRHLIPHTTVFVTGISLSAPTLTDDNQRFVSLINTLPLTYDGILSYSKALRMLAGSPVTSYYAADEGVVVTDIVAVTPTSVSVLGDFQSSNLFVGDEFIIDTSTGNDGTYIITSLTYEFSGSPVSDFVTTFGVAALPDTNVDGTLKLNIPSNVFIIDGSDYTRIFTQGSRVNTTSGSHIGQYTTLNSRYVNDKTYVRVRETLIPEGTGLNILSTGANYITVDGNVTDIYGAGSPAPQFNIVTSAKNDGLYTSDGAIFDGQTTQITFAPGLGLESFDVTDNTGEIHEFASGDITQLPEGFGATVDLCELVPQALSISSITEDFDILLGHKFVIDGTDSATNKVYIQDPNGYVYDIFDAGLNTPEGSPIGSPPIAFVPDTNIEIISSGINNGTYTIMALDTVEGVNTILTLAGSPVLSDSGTFSGSPEINGGCLLYKHWWQYYVTDITGGSPPDTFIVAGDATSDISNGSLIQHIFTDNQYTVTAIDAIGSPVTTTKITVTPDIQIIDYYGTGSPQLQIRVDITAGSPTFDDWIISV